ncbi:MAG: DUF4386 family protein [Anaerolineales bacterium]|nr:DUF4386 family protein [Anaerolineales bacterium]
MTEHTQNAKTSWQSLFRFGYTAPWITFSIYLVQTLAILFASSYPLTTEEWFLQFQQNTILGMLYLNAFDMFSIATLGLLYLALYIALRLENQSYMTIAAFFVFLGITLFVSVRADMFTAILSLSRQYAAAATEAQQARLLAAGDAIKATIRATPETTGFLFLAFGGMLISMVMINSDRFSKATAGIGILGGIVTIANHICLIIAPNIANLLLPVNGLLWLVWWLLTGRSLYRLSKTSAKQIST